MQWKETYNKKTKPAYNELLAFFDSDIQELFLHFDREVNEKFKVHNKYHRYSESYGWIYGFGRSYSCELFSVTIQRESFRVLGVIIEDESSLQKALEEVQKVYDNGFEEQYQAICKTRRANQIERTKKRLEREHSEMEKLIQSINPETFNQFKWCKKASRNDLLRLYQGEAKGMLDEELLDEIGFTFYARCKQAHDARNCMEKGNILCLNCGAVVKANHTYDNQPMYCECGYSYTYREYRRSYMAVNMPGNRATPIFESFEQKWPGCQDATQKMLLIDWLIHECHVTIMSGEMGKSVCENLIEGTRKQITDLIIKLAYAVEGE